MNEFIVLMTATIHTGLHSNDMMRDDPDVRLCDYLNGLLFWGNLIDERIKGIVFCENSSANLQPLKTACINFNTPVEFLSFEGNSIPDGVHYGYAELGIIDYAVLNSNLLKSCPYFIKVTGRLTFPRISNLLDSITFEFDALVDHRRKYRSEKGFPIKSRTQIMILSREYYVQFLLGSRQEMIGHYSHIEDFLAEKFSASMTQFKIVQRFKVECSPEGISRDNKNYSSFSVKCKKTLRCLLRRLYPDCWL